MKIALLSTSLAVALLATAASYVLPSSRAPALEQSLTFALAR